MTEMAVGGRLNGQEPMAPRSLLTTGAVDLEVEPEGIRYLKVHGQELVRRIFVAVRDPAWGTVPGAVIESAVHDGGAGLEISMTLEQVDEAQGIDFVSSGVFHVSLDGRVAFVFNGHARSSFSYARIGLCVLHPVAFAGAWYRALTQHGWIEGRLPIDIAPQLPGPHGFGEPLFSSFEELELIRDDGLGIHLFLAGDLFELEDQRNWTDASFKTYSTPLELGDRYWAEAGDEFRQSFQLTPIGTAAQPSAKRQARSRQPEITLGGVTDLRVLPIGLAAASHGHALGPRLLGLLADLSPAHIRIDLHLANSAMESTLAQADAEADASGAALEVGVLSSEQAAGVERLVAALSRTAADVDRVLVFDQHTTVTPNVLVQQIRNALSHNLRAVPVYGGTDGLFADLNAARPAPEGLDGISYALSPTIHAHDDLSLIETIPIHGETVRTARTFIDGLPVAVGPITLRERSRLASIASEPATRPSSAEDARQQTPLGAGWTLGTAASLITAGADSLTYFETSGDCGLMSHDGSSVYPLYHVVADMCELRGAHLVELSQTKPGSFAAFAARTSSGSMHLLLANLDPVPASITVRGLPRGQIRIRRLTEDTARIASEHPRAYRRLFETPTNITVLELEPHEFVRVEVSP